MNGVDRSTAGVNALPEKSTYLSVIHPSAWKGDGRDELRGGRGFDVCYVDEGDAYSGCEEAATVIE